MRFLFAALFQLVTAQEATIGVLTSDAGCPSGCGAATTVVGTQVAAASFPPSVNSYAGGSTCSSGNNICSCDWPGTWVNGAPRYPSASNPNQAGGVQITVYFTATGACSDSSGAASWGYSACTAADVANRLLKNTADATRCREACRMASSSGVGGCNFAFFGFWTGFCHIFSWDASYLAGGGSCPRTSHWVGSSTSGGMQGGVTFVKGVLMPPPSPPPPSPPPPLPPQALTMSVLTDSTGCASNCTVSGVVASTVDSFPAYSGGASCGSGGNNICTCDWPGSHTGTGHSHVTVYFLPGGAQTTNGSNPLVLRGERSNANPWLCREACRTSATCSYAFFGYWNGICHLFSYSYAYSKPTGNCPKQTMWVGTGARWLGGVTWAKQVPAPPPPPPSPPLSPPLWPPQSLLVDPGEDVWPVAWFGNFSCFGREAGEAAYFNGCTPAEAGKTYEHVEPDPWRDEPNTTVLGYDWGLPPNTMPSPTGLLAMQRSFNYVPTPPRLFHNSYPDTALPFGGPSAMVLPEASRMLFRSTPVYSIWATWLQLEPTEGTYNFAPLHANVAEAARRGWKVCLRILTSHIGSAPTYLAGRNISTRYTDAANAEAGGSYDPIDPQFHARYLAFLVALGASRLCQNETVVMMYAGYASASYGDEYIGPKHPNATSGTAYDPNYDPAALFPHVRERLNAWASVCTGVPSKVLMGGESNYGLSLGFGSRNGFVEHYWYQIPHMPSGQGFESFWAREYVFVNESAPILSSGGLLGDENEEYEGNWASEYMTFSPGERGGRWNASAPMLNGTARWGLIASFPYRYLMSSMRLLQMRVSYLLASSTIVNPALFAYVALELGRTAATSPDAWCFLASTQFEWVPHLARPAEVAHMERWLYQRDEPPSTLGGVVTFRDARITQTPSGFSTPFWGTDGDGGALYDWIARTAPRGVIGFTLSRTFALAPQRPLLGAVIKVSLFDVFAGSVRLTQAHTAAAGSAPTLVGFPIRTVGDGQLKTVTFVAELLPVRPLGSSSTFDFEVRAFDVSGNPQPLVLSMVRVIKHGVAGALVQQVRIAMTASGNVQDFGPSQRADIAGRFATLARVDPTAVAVEVTSASVLITVAITVPDASAAAATQSSITTTLTSPAAASSFTGLAIISAPVVAVVTQVVTMSPSPPPAPPDAPPPPPATNDRLSVNGPQLLGLLGLLGLIPLCLCCCVYRCMYCNAELERTGQAGHPDPRAAKTSMPDATRPTTQASKANYIGVLRWVGVWDLPTQASKANRTQATPKATPKTTPKNGPRAKPRIV